LRRRIDAHIFANSAVLPAIFRCASEGSQAIISPKNFKLSWRKAHRHTRHLPVCTPPGYNNDTGVAHSYRQAGCDIHDIYLSARRLATTTTPEWRIATGRQDVTNRMWCGGLALCHAPCICWGGTRSNAATIIRPSLHLVQRPPRNTSTHPHIHSLKHHHTQTPPHINVPTLHRHLTTHHPTPKQPWVFTTTRAACSRSPGTRAWQPLSRYVFSGTVGTDI